MASTETRRLVRRSVAVKSICAAPARGARFQAGELAHQPSGFVDTGARFAGAGLGAAAEPLHFAADLVGERFLAARLREQELFLLLQELAVAAIDAEKALGIDAVDLGHVVDHVVQEVAVVAHHHAGEGGRSEQPLEPQDAFEIEVVGGLVEEEQVGIEGQLARNGEPALPSAGEGFRRGGAVGETGPAERLVDARGTLEIVEALARDGGGDDFRGGELRREAHLLRHVTDTRVAPHGDGAGIGLHFAGQNFQERGLAGAVGTDQAEALAFRDAERDVLEQHARPESLGERGTAFEERHYS